MRKSSFIEEQTIKVLKEHAAGRGQVICVGSTASVMRRSASGDRAMAGWRISNVRKLKGLEEENRKRWAGSVVR